MVDPTYWDLNNLETELARNPKHLDVESEALYLLLREDLPNNVARKTLEPALGIPDAREDHLLDKPVKYPPHRLTS